MFWGQEIASALGMVQNMPWQMITITIFCAIVFEAPRYAMTFVPALIVIFSKRREYSQTPLRVGRVSVLLAGHNEADVVEKCVLSLHNQTFRDFELICVSDGSTDKTFEIMAKLQRKGLVDKIAECQIRGGKSSAINLGMRLASGDIVVVLDCDCSFEPDAIEQLLRPFQEDPKTAAVGGCVLVRNGEASITASLQAIEYLVSICLGRVALEMANQLTIVSGAFGAFRASAFREVGGMDPGPGEDFDLTLRLRLYGYTIRYALNAVAFTDVPTSLFNLLRQRARWERDALWLRYRKYEKRLNPFRLTTPLRDIPHQIDFLLFDVLCTIIFAFFIPYMLYYFDFYNLLFTLFVYYLMVLFLDIFMFICAVLASGRIYYAKYWPFIFIYGPFKGYLMRFARLYCGLEEWIFSSSRSDNFAPPKVNDWIRWK